MSQSKTIKVCTQLSVTSPQGSIKSQIPSFENSSIECKLNLSTKGVEEFYLECKPGEVVVYVDTTEDFYFDINKNGELIVIFPPNFDFEINSSGELLFYKE